MAEQSIALAGLRQPVYGKMRDRILTPDSPARSSPPWSGADSWTLACLLLAALALYFWKLNTPPHLVYDEKDMLMGAYCYVRGLPAVAEGIHPPLANLLMWLTIVLFGDNPWGWRIPSAVLGTALVVITYLLGRRMFSSSLAGALAAAMVLCDGMFLIHSRLALNSISYVTFGAWAYLLFFRLVQSKGFLHNRLLLVCLAALLGLSLGAKLLIPGIGWLLVVGFLLAATIQWGWENSLSRLVIARYCAGLLALVGAVSASVYLTVFIPHYWFGWWKGIEAFPRYYRWLISANLNAPTTRAQASPWWTWPFLLRPYAYWRQVRPAGMVTVIWCGGNPVLWWGAFMAMVIQAVRLFTRPTLERTFLVFGYIGYVAMWIPIKRYIFIYDHLPAVYLAFLALAAVLAECWRKEAPIWEQVMLLIPLLPTFVLALGSGIIGATLYGVVLILFIILTCYSQYASRFVFVIFTAAGLMLFIYFLPVWVASPISLQGYLARMWLSGSSKTLNWR